MRVPKYRPHSTRDYAIVEWKKERLKLPGRFNSPESKAAYKAFLSKFVFGAPLPPDRSDPQHFTIQQLVSAYLRFARVQYPEREGAETTEYDNCRLATLPLLELFKSEVAASFGPLKLKALQKHLVAKGDSPRYINARVGRIKRAFKWAVSEELVPPAVFQGISTVASLPTEPKQKKWIDFSSLELVLPFLSPPVQAMALFQWHTGARSQSVCAARIEQFTFEDELWLWRPRHKTEHLGAELVLPIGPLCQKVLGLYMDRKPGEYLFSPRAVGSSRRYRTHYTSGTYYSAVKAAIQRAAAAWHGPAPFIAPWTPHVLRHSKGHMVRERYGVEAAQSTLGHESLDATEIYSARRIELARQVARETG